MMRIILTHDFVDISENIVDTFSLFVFWLMLVCNLLGDRQLNNSNERKSNYLQIVF